MMRRLTINMLFPTDLANDPTTGRTRIHIMLTNASDYIWILIFCLTTSSIAIYSWIRAVIADHKLEEISDQLAVYAEASVNMAANLRPLMQTVPVTTGGAGRLHILHQAQARLNNGMSPQAIEQELGLRRDEMQLMRLSRRSK